MSPTLRIDTDDGAEIKADGRGFATRGRSEASEWEVVETLRFRTDDARDAWLDRAFGLWEGESTRSDTAPATAPTCSETENA